MLELIFKKEELKLLLPFYLKFLIDKAFRLTSLFSVLYFLEIGLNLVQISFIISTNYIAQLLLEVPTGAISDIFGRKVSVLISFIGISLCLILVPFTTNYYLILLLYFGYGAFMTFKSGSDEAWAIDNLKYYKKENLVKEFYIKRHSIKNLGLCLTGIIGAIFIALFGLKVIWFIGVLGNILCFILLFFTKEYKIINKTHKKRDFNIINQVKRSIIYIKQNKIIFILMLCTFLSGISTCLRSFKIVWSVFFTNLGLSAIIIGLINSLSAVTGIILPYTSNYFSKLIKSENKLIAIMFLVQIITLCAIYFVTNSTSAIIIFFIVYFIVDIITPTRNHFFQKHITSKVRATITSSENMFKSVAYIIGTPLAAFLIETVGIKLTFVASGLILIPFVILYYNINKNTKV